MIVFRTKKELIDFFKFTLDKLSKRLKESQFEIDLKIIPIDAHNLKAVFKTFKEYGEARVIKEKGVGTSK